VISSWLLKIVLAVAVAGIVLFELGSPLVTRATLDNTAHEAADDAARELTQTHDPDRARAVAEEQAADGHARLEDFSVDERGTVRVTLFKQAKSYVLHNFDPTRSWYDVRVKASAASL